MSAPAPALVRQKSIFVLRPSTDRGVGKFKDGRDHLQVRGDVKPRRHAHIVEEFQAALVAHGRDDSGDVLKVVAEPQVVIRHAEGILFAAGDRAAPADAKNGGPLDRVWLAIADAEVAEHAPTARLIRGVNP